LRDRTILIAQKKEDIPFDLSAYAYHIYDWKNPEEIRVLKEKIKMILTDIDNNPTRADNPVSDFLKVQIQPSSIPMPEVITPAEVVVAQPLTGIGAEGLNVIGVVKNLASSGLQRGAKTITRLTRAELLPSLVKVVSSLNSKNDNTQIKEDEILERAMPYIFEIEPFIKNIEMFGLASTIEGWMQGLTVVNKISGDLISLTEKPRDAKVIKFAQGSPALMAWRMLCLCGIKALEENEPEILEYVLHEPIEVEESTGNFSHLSFIQRHDLFYPEAFLGHANYPMRYLDNLWVREKHLKLLFETNDSYQLALANFFVLIPLIVTGNGGRPFYPGYRLLKQANRAMAYTTSKLFSSSDFARLVARLARVTLDDFMKGWTERVKKINEVRSERLFWFDTVGYPEEFGKQ